jgi:hypothetical protein
MKIQNMLVGCDRVCDYIPVISTVTNLVDLFIKNLSCIHAKVEDCKKAGVEGNHYYQHLIDKTACRCVILLIPILGNIVIALWDLINKRRFDNPDYVLKVTEKQPILFQKASVRLRSDPAFVLKVLEKGSVHADFVLQHTPTLVGIKEVVSEAVKQSGNALRFASAELQANKEVVHDAVSKYGLALSHAHPDLRKDPDVAFAAFMQTPQDQKKVLIYIHADLKKDKEFMLKLIKENPASFDNANPALKKDKEFIMAALRLNGLILRFVDKEFKDDPECVNVACSQNGLALEFAGAEVKKNKPTVLIAVMQHDTALKFADSSIQGDFELVKLASGLIPETLNDNKEVMLVAVNKNYKNFPKVDSSLKKDKEFVVEVLKKHGILLKDVDGTLKKDEDCVKVAVMQDGMALQYADEGLKANKEVVVMAIKQKLKEKGKDEALKVLKFAAPALLENDTQLAGIAAGVEELDAA